MILRRPGDGIIRRCVEQQVLLVESDLDARKAARAASASPGDVGTWRRWAHSQLRAGQGDAVVSQLNHKALNQDISHRLVQHLHDAHAAAGSLSAPQFTALGHALTKSDPRHVFRHTWDNSKKSQRSLRYSGPDGATIRLGAHHVAHDPLSVTVRHTNRSGQLHSPHSSVPSESEHQWWHSDAVWEPTNSDHRHGKRKERHSFHHNGGVHSPDTSTHAETGTYWDSDGRVADWYKNHAEHGRWTSRDYPEAGRNPRDTSRWNR